MLEGSRERFPLSPGVETQEESPFPPLNISKCNAAKPSGDLVIGARQPSCYKLGEETRALQRTGAGSPRGHTWIHPTSGLTVT